MLFNTSNKDKYTTWYIYICFIYICRYRTTLCNFLLSWGCNCIPGEYQAVTGVSQMWHLFGVKNMLEEGFPWHIGKRFWIFTLYREIIKNVQESGNWVVLKDNWMLLCSYCSQLWLLVCGSFGTFHYSFAGWSDHIICNPYPSLPTERINTYHPAGSFIVHWKGSILLDLCATIKQLLTWFTFKPHKHA